MGERESELYIHIPFCVRKCKYCDFLSAPADAQVQNAYMEALLEEVRESADDIGVPALRENGRGTWENAVRPGQDKVTSIYIGGGTPSVVDPVWMEKLMACIREHYRVAEQAEITIEVNPGTVTRESLMRYRHAGINRLSIGCQSTDDKELARIGRIHTFAQFRDTYRWARETGFTNVNVDLMNALPGQIMADVERNLERILGLDPGPEHLSVYSLIVEEGTPFYRMWENGEFEAKGMELPDEEQERAMYWRTAELLRSYGYAHYEISNFAKPGYESRHNSGYWQRRDYLGFGLGAASLYENTRFSNTGNLHEYLSYWGNRRAEAAWARGAAKTEKAASERVAPGSEETAGYRSDRRNERTEEQDIERIRVQMEALSVQDAMEETMFLGLRMAEGVSAAAFRERFGCGPETVYGEELRESIQEGLLERKESAAGGENGKGISEGDVRYVLTKRGVDVSNYVMAKFLRDT